MGVIVQSFWMGGQWQGGAAPAPDKSFYLELEVSDLIVASVSPAALVSAAPEALDFIAAKAEPGDYVGAAAETDDLVGMVMTV